MPLGISSKGALANSSVSISEYQVHAKISWNYSQQEPQATSALMHYLLHLPSEIRFDFAKGSVQVWLSASEA